MRRIWVTTFVVLALFSWAVRPQDDTEKRKIEFLISSVESLQGAAFIRNGTAHTAKEAAEHLRMKLRMVGARVKTADDFIRLCASKSYLSGEPYLIRLPDGKTITSEDYFRGKLREYHAISG